MTLHTTPGNNLFGIVLLVSACLLAACTKNSSSGEADTPKFKQYYNQGAQLYEMHCSNCHQKDGTGLGRLYPPLSQSDFLRANFNEVICLIRNGKEGRIVVNGKDYNMPMPGITSLTDLEIAEISTYIYNSWGHQRGIVEVKDVSSILNSCAE